MLAPTRPAFAGASISGDGRCVSFDSLATDLVPNDANGIQDIFVHDTLTGAVTRVSLGLGGVEPDADCTARHQSHLTWHIFGRGSRDPRVLHRRARPRGQDALHP